MSNSALVVYKRLSPNCTKPRNHKIDTITIHCMAGNLSVESCGSIFADAARQASSNYGIGSDGRIVLYVDEVNRSWCTNSSANDHRAVTIEVANNGGAPDWPISDKAYAALLDLVTDICKRNDMKELLWRGDKSLIGQVEKQNMTVHRWFASKACPGDYLYIRHAAIAAEVNRRLADTANKEEGKMTQQEFNKMMDIYLKERNTRLESDWAKEVWADAKTRNIVDGSAPQGFATREQLVMILSKL